MLGELVNVKLTAMFLLRHSDYLAMSRFGTPYPGFLRFRSIGS